MDANTGAVRPLLAVGGQIIGKSVGVSRDNRWITYTETGTEDTTILRAIADLGAAYELEVVAEGIDTGAKLAVLRAIGCRYGQGYLFARPLPLPEALEMWDPR